MPYSKVKVYSDGNHFIGIPYKPNPYAGKRKSHPEEKIVVQEKTANVTEICKDEDTSVLNSDSAEKEKPITNKDSVPSTQKEMTRKQLFEELYAKGQDKCKREQKNYIFKEMLDYFDNKESCLEFVKQNMERKERNLICRKIRMWRKINQQNFNFFVTLTFDDKLHTEESFQKALKNCLQHFSSRKGWRYIGVWERSPEKHRLHFHGIFYIPDGTMPGKLEALNDFDTRAKKMRTTMQNDFFGKKFGRNDFNKIAHVQEIPQAIKYLTKYLEKTGEKLVYSRGLYQYFITDIMDEDIVCPYGLVDRKILLFDNFQCWDEGEYIGTVSPETIAKLPKSN